MKNLKAILVIASLVILAGVNAQAEDYSIAQSRSRVTTSRGGGDGVRNLRITDASRYGLSEAFNLSDQECFKVECGVTVCEDRNGRDPIRALPNTPEQQKQADELQQKIDRRECRIERHHNGAEGRVPQLVCESSN